MNPTKDLQGAVTQQQKTFRTKLLRVLHDLVHGGRFGSNMFHSAKLRKIVNYNTATLDISGDGFGLTNVKITVAKISREAIKAELLKIRLHAVYKEELEIEI